jgi:hypothetical protein
MNLSCLRGVSDSCKRFTVHVLTFCVLSFGGSALAQQKDQQQSDEVATTSQQPDAPDVTVARNTAHNNETNDCGGIQPCGRQDQRPLPNAPSTFRPAATVTPLTFGERSSIYAHAIFRPYTMVGPAFGAAIGQWEDEPPEWGQGGQGYGRRIASGMGRHLISETIRFGLAAADGEDPRYRRSQETGVWNRARHAIVETFTSETASGTRIPAYSRFAGIYGAAFIANVWYPDSRNTPGYALRRGSTALGSSLGFHLFEEFIPRKYFKALEIQN